MVPRRNPAAVWDWRFWVVLAAAFVPSLLRGAAPALDHFYPVALQIGSTNAVTAIGEFDPWPPKVWVDSPGILFKPETNSGKFMVEVATNAPVGPHLVRVYNAKGASRPRFLIVAQEPQLSEQEPNDDFKNPQVVGALPAAINGRLEKSGDVDSFAVALEAGQTLLASVEAYTLASPLDAVLRLVDARGVTVAMNHDDGRTLDPFLAWTANAPGLCVLQVFGFAYPAGSDVRFTGNNKCVYRLHLSRGAWLRYTLPLGVARNGRTSLRTVGWNVGPNMGSRIEFDGATVPGPSARTSLQLPGFENARWLAVGDGPELEESEFGDSAHQAIPRRPPWAVTACIDKPGEEDRFPFIAKKGGKLLLEIQSASLGFTLDARMRIEESKGKELAKSDDGSTSDPFLEWTPPEDGTFVAVVANLLHRGGPEHVYRLSIRPAAPAWKGTVSESALAIEPGATNDIKVTVQRMHGLKSKLSVSTQGLPVGLRAEPVDVSEKGGEVVLKLIAASDSIPFSGPIRIFITEAESGKQQSAIAELIASGVDNGVPNGFGRLVVESTEQCWLTVLAAEVKPAGAVKK